MLTEKKTLMDVECHFPAPKVTYEQCKTAGFDCVVKNQCVNHGTIVSGVNTSDPGFLYAQTEVNQNPYTILNYPQYFYNCAF